MNLNVKVAALTSLVFIVGMCWLVSQVSTPIAALPTAVVNGSPKPSATDAKRPAAGARPSAARPVAARDRDSRSLVTVDGARSVDTFERPSPASEKVISQNKPAERITVPLPPMATATSPNLPPIHVAGRTTPAAVESAPNGLASNVSSVASAPAVQPVSRPRDAAVGQVGSDSEIFVSSTDVGRATGFGQRTPSPATLIADRGASVEPKTSPLPVIPESDPAPAATVVEHNVQRGESLAKICQKHYGSKSPEILAEVLKANPALVRKPDALRIGQSIKLPALGSVGHSVAEKPEVKSTQSVKSSRTLPKSNAGASKRGAGQSKPKSREGGGVFDNGKANIFSDDGAPTAPPSDAADGPAVANSKPVRGRGKPIDAAETGPKNGMPARGSKTRGDKLGSTVVKAVETRSTGRPKVAQRGKP